MEIAIIGDLLAHKTLTGVENYLYQLLQSIELSEKNSVSVLCSVNIPKERIPAKIKVHQPKNHLLKIAGYAGGLFFNYKKIAQYDVIHLPTISVPVFSRNYKTQKRVMTVHDLGPILYPEFCTIKRRIIFNYFLKYIFSSIDHFITPSLAVKKDLVSQCKIDPNQISVIYEGVSDGFRPIKKPKKDYILAVSTLEPRKNFKRIIDAYIFLKKKHKINEKLIIVGKKGWRYHDIFCIPDDLKKNIIFTGYVPEKMLIRLYQNAKLFVYPSFYEGFGLPVVEALACGCPVVTSNVSSMPEVAENAALLVNPQNVNDIAAAMLLIIQNDEFANSLVRKGLKHVNKFTWTKCAQETLKIYEMVYKC